MMREKLEDLAKDWEESANQIMAKDDFQRGVRDTVAGCSRRLFAILAAEPEPSAANTEGLRELRMGFIHGATWAGRSLKSATRVANLRYPPDASLRGEGK